MNRHAAPDDDALVPATGARFRFKALSRREKGLVLAVVLLLLFGGGGWAYAAASVTTATVDCDAATSVPNSDGTVTIPMRCRVTVPDGPTPTPSATQTASPSPSATVSPSPTAAPTAAPTTSTAVPTTPPVPSPSTSSPTPSPTQQTGCMPKPSACGWPDATNTGTHGGLTVVNGTVTLSTPGQVYENRDVRGCIVVRAKGVTIRNVKVTCGGYYAISVNAGPSSNPWNAGDAGLVVEDVEIDLAGQLEGKAIAFDGYTLRRAYVHGGSDCAHAGLNVVIVDSFCDIPAGGPIDGPHYDGIQSDGGRNITIRHNTIRVPYAQTSAILVSTNTSPIRDVSIVDNLVAGGGYSIYCGTGAGGPVLGTFTFSGNRVAKTYFSRGGYWGPETMCPASGWTWD